MGGSGIKKGMDRERNTELLIKIEVLYLKNMAQMSAGDLISKANKLQREGKFDEAVAMYRSSIELNPNFAWTYYYLAETFAKQNLGNEAIAALDTALTINPNNTAFAALKDKLKLKLNPTKPRSRWPICAIREVKNDETMMAKAESFPNVYAHARNIILPYLNTDFHDRKPRIMEIGGSISSNARKQFPEFDYYNIDLINRDDIPTIVADITHAENIESESFDLIFSNNTFEHINRPWLAAKEICRILTLGCVCYISTVFSWRYHPVPIDYWRYSPDCLTFLFNDLLKIEANFNNFYRRKDIQGFWPNKLDECPVDRFGGWRENWVVYFAGKKVKQESQFA